MLRSVSEGAYKHSYYMRILATIEDVYFLEVTLVMISDRKWKTGNLVNMHTDIIIIYEKFDNIFYYLLSVHWKQI